MSNDLFQRPSNDFFAAKSYDGKLVLFESIGQPYTAKTDFGDSDAIDADVTVIDADGGPKVFTKSRVFGAALVGTLSRSLPGKPLLGRIGQGQAKAGQSAPWILEDYTDQDAALAGAYLTQRASGAFSRPATPAPAPQQAPVETRPAPDFAQAAPVAVNPPATPAGIDPEAYAAALAALGGTVVAASPETPGY